jgi:hypothetical protein
MFPSRRAHFGPLWAPRAARRGPSSTFNGTESILRMRRGNVVITLKILFNRSQQSQQRLFLNPRSLVCSARAAGGFPLGAPESLIVSQINYLEKANEMPSQTASKQRLEGKHNKPPTRVERKANESGTKSVLRQYLE